MRAWDAGFEAGKADAATEWLYGFYLSTAKEAANEA
jgi:hypothetical protein